MKTTVEYVNVKFTQEGNTITCDLVSNIRFDKVKNMECFVEMYDVYAYLQKVCDSKGRFIVHTRGTAKCGPNDTFDFETGKRLAHTRAQMKVFERAAEFYDEIIKRASIDIDNTATNCFISMLKCENHIQDLIEKTV